MTQFNRIKEPIRNIEAIVRQIEKKILMFELRPNDILPNETEMTRQFGVGRSTVREALRMLEASGLIVIKHGSRGGPTVNKITDDFISDFLAKSIRLGGFTVDSLVQFRLAIEPSIAEMLAASGLKKEVLNRLEKNIIQTQRLYEADRITGYSNMEFHMLLASATGNPMFIVIMKTLKLLFYSIIRNIPDKYRGRLSKMTIDYHVNILEAIKNRDPWEANKQMRDHMVRHREVLLLAGMEQLYGKK